MTVETFINERYWPKIKPTLSAQWQKHTEHLLCMIVDYFGEQDLCDIPLEDIDGWWMQLQARFSTPVTPNKVLVRAKHIWKTAIRWKVAHINPFSDIKRQREQEHKFTPLSAEEHVTVFEDASPALQWYLIFARYTGARRSSLAKLEERDINLSRNTLTFRETKNGDDYTIPIHPILREWCSGALTGVPTRRALPQYADVHAISQLFRRLTKRNGVSGFRFHDYRHNVGTKLAEHGYDVKVRMDMLGHKDPRMAIKYTHIAKEVLEAAIKEAL